MTALRGIVGTLSELFRFLWARKLWWMMPMVIVLVLFAGLIVLGGAGGLGPFIYSLF